MTNPGLPDERTMVDLPSPSASPRPSSLPPTSRTSTPPAACHSPRSSRAPSPIRSLAQKPLLNRALPSATANVNATGDAISNNERDHLARKLKAHKASIADNQEQGMIRPAAQPASPVYPDMATQPSYRRTQSQRLPRTSIDRPSEAVDSSRTYSSQQTSELQEKERKRLKAAAAAKLAEQEAWEKTRGAGSAVLDLLKASDESDDNSADSGGERASRANTPGSVHSHLTQLGDSNSNSNSNSNSGSGSAGSNGSGRGRPSVKGQPPKKRSVPQSWEAAQVLPALEDVQGRHHEPILVPSADKLLSRGISEYTILPKILGRGKFSTVFLASKAQGPTGEPQLFAVKHTPLFPHHPLIATRLLREPTLLAELPPHPNLVNVYETIRTPGHFYLVEEYLGGYVTLEALLPLRSEQSPPNSPILPTGVANFILDQLLAAVNAIHHPLQICHRDIKPENVLVHPDTLQLKLLDFGLATHYSRSEPKLSTCCGSPAFHCPEIVTALRNPLGSVRYWGPEVDAWTCGVTMLRLLNGVRYPIGASHSSVRSMSIKAQRAVSTIQDPELRDRIAMLLECNGERRMKNFDDLVRALEQDQAVVQRRLKDFKSTTFIPTTPEHTMNLPLVVGPAAETALVSPLLPSGATPSGSRRTTPLGSRSSSPARAGTARFAEDFSGSDFSPPPSLLLSNPTAQPPSRVLSYVKYCLRSAGILYHCWPDTSSVASLPSTPSPFDKAFHDFNSADTSSVKPKSDPSSSSSSDVTPPPNHSPSTPFPLQALRSERDPYLHIHVFECVLQIVDEPEPTEQQPTLVQTIFSALSFGRRPANRRSSSTPPGAEGINRPPKSAGAQGDPSGNEASAGSSGDVRCLVFYLVLRFPRKLSGTQVQSRPAFSRSSSVAGRQSRSRASSSATPDGDRVGPPRVGSSDSLALLTKLNSAHAEFATGIHPTKKAMIDSNNTTPRASRTSSPSVAYNALKKREGSLAGSGQTRGRSRNEGPSDTGIDLGLTIETSPDLLRIAEAQKRSNESGTPRSAPSSRATSRARSRKSSRARDSSLSHSHHQRGSNKVLVHVSDRRALDAVQKALSIGGTTTDYNPDSETDQEEAPGWLSPALLSREFFANHESDAGPSAQSADRKLRPRIQRRPMSVGGTPAGSGQGKGGSWIEPSAVAASSAGSDDGEQYTRGRSLGPASSLVPSGIPFPANMHRLRAPSNLSFAVVQEESSPSNTEHSASQSKTMLDFRSQSAKAEETNASTATASAPFSLSNAVFLVSDRNARALESGDVNMQFLNDTEQQLSTIFSHLSAIQEDSKQQLLEQLDTLSFDMVKAFTPLLGLVNDDGSPTSIASLSRRLLSLLADNASSRELYMAIDLRCGELLAAPDSVEPQIGTISWLKIAETTQLLYLLNTIVPKIRTRKPQQFSSVFVLLPKCLALGLKSASNRSSRISETLATSAIEACCSSVLIVADWEFKCMDDTSRRSSAKKTSREALAHFLAGVTNCLPYLAGAETSLSEDFFFTVSPQYATVNGSSSREKCPSVVKRNESTFAELTRTLASLGLELGPMWLNSLQAMASSPEDESARELLTVLGINGFILDTHLMASGYSSERPSEWSDTHARTQLEAALPVVLLSLAEQTRQASSPELEQGNEDLMSDASLLRLQWCFGAFTDAQPLSRDLTTSLANTLATQSVVSPSPVARHIRFRLLTNLLVKNAEVMIAVQILGELATQSPFSQMQAGAISILRNVTIAAAGEASRWSEAASDLIALFDRLFVLPARITQADVNEATANVLAEEAQKLTEKLSLLLTLSSHRIADVDVKHYQTEFLLPLNKVLSDFKHAQLSPESSQAIQLLCVAADRAVHP